MRPAALLFVGVGRAFALAVVLATVLRWTVFGSHLYAMGPKEQVARFRDIKMTTTRVVSDALLVHWRIGRDPGCEALERELGVWCGRGMGGDCHSCDRW
jgi:hypothetical protein